MEMFLEPLENIQQHCSKIPKQNSNRTEIYMLFSFFSSFIDLPNQKIAKHEQEPRR